MNQNNIGETILPFGKYKGDTFDEAPLSYLDWLVDQKWLFDGLKEKLASYLNDPVIQRELEEELTQE